MPTYGYKCTECADTFERLQKMTDDPLTACEKCGGKLKKLLYPVGISFKGEGFYVTDYKGAGKDPKATAPVPEATTPTTQSAASTETPTSTPSVSEAKPETKNEAKSETKPATTEAKTSA
jgi:putative FmdB family regulatory protein